MRLIEPLITTMSGCKSFFFWSDHATGVTLKRQLRRGLWLWCNDDSGAIDVWRFGWSHGTFDGCIWTRVAANWVSNSGMSLLWSRFQQWWAWLLQRVWWVLCGSGKERENDKDGMSTLRFDTKMEREKGWTARIQSPQPLSTQFIYKLSILPWPKSLIYRLLALI